MKLEISIQAIKELRDKTFAGMMDCKKALQESNGDIKKAMEILDQKGLIFANARASKPTAEGLIETYVHLNGRIGSMVELSCETDFVARRVEFHELAKNIAMQIAASPLIKYINLEDIPTEVIEREKNIELFKADLAGKTKVIRDNMIHGRVQKRLKELVLVEQMFIRDSSITIENLLKENIAKLGENIQIKRFERFSLGEKTP